MPTTAPASPVRTALLITAKELRESLRDRATVMYAFVLPICMYPVIFWCVLQGIMVFEGQEDHTVATLGIVSSEGPADAHPRATPALLEALEALGEDGSPGQTHVLELRLAHRAMSLDQAQEWLTPTDPVQPPEAAAGRTLGTAESELSPTHEERPDAVLDLDTMTLLFDSTVSESGLASKRARRRIEQLRERIRNQSAVAAGLEEADLRPLSIKSTDLSDRGAKGAIVLASILPMLLVVMAVMGSFFPAVDLTAGEKERGTAETTLLIPLHRSAVIQGKVLAVAALAMTATGLSLFALALSAENLLAKIPAPVDLSISIPTLAILGGIPLAMFFSVFVSSILTAFASLAANFKEGQALLGPVQMVFILPAVLGIIPGIELSPALACVPIINVVLAFRAMLMGEPLLLEYSITAGALALYAWLALRLAVHLLSRESVQLAGKTLSIGRLLNVLRSSSTTH